MIHVFKESWPFLFLSSQRKFLFLRAGLQGKESPRHFIKLLILLCYSVSLRRLWIERWRRKFMERNIRLLTLTCIRQILKSSPPKVSLVKNHLPSASLFEFYFFNFKRQFLDLLLTHSNIYFSAHVFLWGGKYLGKRNTKTTCLWIFQDCTCRQVKTWRLTLRMADYWQHATSIPEQKTLNCRCSQKSQSRRAFQRINNNEVTRYFKKKMFTLEI